MIAPSGSIQSRNIARSRKNCAAIEEHLTRVEKTRGCAEAWALRERIEQGRLTLRELKLRR